MKTIHDFYAMKQSGERITMITCYDYTSARIVNSSNIDCILVGDSAVMVMHGASTTVAATVDHIATHTLAVAKGAPDKFIVADLPFMSYRKSLVHSMEAAEILMRAGAQAIKLEGADGNLEFIRHCVDSGIPVMGHLGLTPQHINMLGGYKVQGKDASSSEKLLYDAKLLAEAGCFALVLECVPESVATQITQEITIPTIGIGAGVGTNGQVLVFQDMLGLQTDMKFKFLKVYLDGATLFTQSINQYVTDVKTKQFPAKEHSF